MSQEQEKQSQADEYLRAIGGLYISVLRASKRVEELSQHIKALHQKNEQLSRKQSVHARSQESQEDQMEVMSIPIRIE